MNNALIQRLLANGAGANPAEILRDHLKDKCNSDGRLFTTVSVLLAVVAVAILAEVATLVLHDEMAGLPVLGVLARMPDGHLQTLVYVSLALASALFVMLMRLREQKTRHAILLIMVVKGEVAPAASLMFGGGKSSMAGEVLKTFVGSLTPG